MGIIPAAEASKTSHANLVSKEAKLRALRRAEQLATRGTWELLGQDFDHCSTALNC